MKKELFSFEENIENVEKFKNLGFEIDFDDNQFYCSLDLSNYDLLNVLSICDDLINENLDVDIIIDEEYFVLSKDYDKIDNLINQNPLLV
jgi:hypothetical protein